MPRYDFKISSSAALTISGASATTGTSDNLPVQNEPLTYVAQLDLTAAATESGDSLALWIQTSFDGGTRWHDVARFANVAGNASVPHTQKVAWTTGQVTTAQESIQNKAIAAGTVRNGPCGNLFRLAWTITQASTTGNESWTGNVILWGAE